MRINNLKRAAIAGSAALVLVLSACSSSEETATESTEAGAAAETSAEAAATECVTEGQVGFLMPDLASTRYEEQDAPLFTASMGELSPGIEVLYQNADADPAKQQQQADAMIAQGVKAIVISSVDTAAAASRWL